MWLTSGIIKEVILGSQLIKGLIEDSLVQSIPRNTLTPKERILPSSVTFEIT